MICDIYPNFMVYFAIFVIDLQAS